MKWQHFQFCRQVGEVDIDPSFSGTPACQKGDTVESPLRVFRAFCLIWQKKKQCRATKE